MLLFADTADTAILAELNEAGLVDGVTTNPTIIAKSGRNIAEVIKEICELIEGPISAEVAATDAATMINDLATYRLDPDRPLPNTGDIRSDIVAWASEILNHYRKPINAAILRGGAAVAGDDESDCLHGRLDEAAILVQRAGDAADVAAQDVIDHVLAPIIYRVIFLPATLTEDYGQRLTDTLFADRPSAS